MKTSFNLKTFRKQAFYEGAKGQITSQTRCLMNCYKLQREKNKKIGAQEAWSNCLGEYNSDKKSGNWSSKYS